VGASWRLSWNNSSDFSEGYVRLHFRSARHSTAAFVIALSLVFPAAGFAGGRSSATVVAGATTHIDNFGRVDATYYRGSQPEGRDYADLAALGVKTIINLTSDDAEADEQAMTEQAGMRYVHIPMTTHRPPTEAQLTEFLRLVSDPAGQPVYVHCVGGRHRTGVMTAVYRIAVQRWSADQAFKEMKQYRFGADFLHSEFKNFVYAYHPPVAAAGATDDGLKPATTLE
jgi:tyrosine-protein phosphatase SIW14